MAHRNGGMDCWLEKPYRFSRKARCAPEMVSKQKQVEDIRMAYSQKQTKFILGANSLVNRSLQKKRGGSPSNSGKSFNSGYDMSTIFNEGGSYLEECSVVSGPSFLTTSQPGSVEDISVGSIIREYKGALNLARQAQDELLSGAMFSPIKSSAKSTIESTSPSIRLGSTSCIRMQSNSRDSSRLSHRPNTGDKTFACRYDGCQKSFSVAKDLFIHECQTHTDIDSRGPIFIPISSTMSADATRASTANLIRRVRTRSNCLTGSMLPVPISRPRTANMIPVEVLQQQKKAVEFQQLVQWSVHREVLEDYRKKLDRELGKTRDRLPMGPLARRALTMVMDEDSDCS